MLVIDGLGAGAAVDADAFGDAGADTLGHVAAAAGGLRLGALERLGLGCAAPLPGVAAPPRPDAVVGRLAALGRVLQHHRPLGADGPRDRGRPARLPGRLRRR